MMFELKLSEEDLKIVIAALYVRTYAEVYQTIDRIMVQVRPQEQEAKPSV